MTTPRFDKDPNDWMAFANCRGVDPDLFFPERGEDARPAKVVCAGCVVRQQCADYADANTEKYGVWGGRSESERRFVRSRRARELAGVPVEVPCVECGAMFDAPTRQTTLCSTGCRYRRRERLRRERYATRESA